MTPREAAAHTRARLAAQIADDRRALEQLAGALGSLLAPAADARTEWIRSLALAFEVERYYTAVEAVLTRVLRTIDREVPAGPGSRQELLRVACIPVAHVRPAVVPAPAVDDLRELLKFRHLARHGYEAEPQLPRMVDHAERVMRVQPVLIAGSRRSRGG